MDPAFVARPRGRVSRDRRLRVVLAAAAASVALLVAGFQAAGPSRRTPSAGPATAPAVGVAVNLDSSATPAARQAILDTVRRTGASFFALELSWSAAEPRPGEYRIDEVTRAARVLRQSGATLHLDLPLVTESVRDVPADLSGVPFDDTRLSLRLGRLLDALLPALLDFQTVSLGDGADSYFAAHPDELRPYRRLFDGAVQFLTKKAPHLLVGVTTAAPTESVAPEVAGTLHQRSPVLFYVYSPFVRGEPFTAREPDDLEKDWNALLKSAAGRPIAFPVVSYSSSPDNKSSLSQQAEFVRRLRRYLESADGRTLLFARYVALRDAAGEAADGGDASQAARRRTAFLTHRGLQEADGTPKPAWREWVRASPHVKK